MAPGGHREAVRARPEVARASSTTIVDERLPAGLGVPHRPLPRQGDRPEHPGAAVRQPAVRADLERQLRRPRADHDGRGHRHRRPRRLLRRHRRRPRRHPEPPAAAAGADRDGGADLLRRPATCAPRRRRCSRPSALPGGPRPGTPRAASTPAAGRAARRCVGYLRGGGHPAELHDRDLRRDPLRRSTPAAGPACRSTCAPASGWAGGSPRSRSSSSGRRTCRSTRTATEELGQNAIVIRVQPDEGVTMRFGVEGAGHRDGGPRRHDGLRLRRLVHRVLPRGLRAADPRRAARRPAAVPAARGGRAVLADPRPDRPSSGPAGPSARPVRGRHLGARGRRTRCWPATAARPGGEP